MLDSTIHTMVEVLDNLKSEIIGTHQILKRAQLCDYYHRVLEMIPDDFKSSSAYYGPAWKDSSVPTITLEQKVIEHKVTAILQAAEHFAIKISDGTDFEEDQWRIKALKDLVKKIPDIEYTGLYFDGKPMRKHIDLLKDTVEKMIVLL